MSFHFYSSRLRALSRTWLAACTLISLLNYWVSFAFPVIPKANCDISSIPYIRPKYLYLSHCNYDTVAVEFFSGCSKNDRWIFFPVPFQPWLPIPGSSRDSTPSNSLNIFSSSLNKSQNGFGGMGPWGLSCSAPCMGRDNHQLSRVAPGPIQPGKKLIEVMTS